MIEVININENFDVQFHEITLTIYCEKIQTESHFLQVDSVVRIKFGCEINEGDTL